jgi:hypothetical protein
MREIEQMKEEQLVKMLKVIREELDRRRELVMEKCNFVYPIRRVNHE